jgi:hypothetical protein
VLRTGDGDDDFIKMPFIDAARGSPTDAVGELAAEFQAPLADRLVRDRDAARRQHLLDHAQAQLEPEIQPDRVADEFGGVAIASEKRVSVRRHPGQISDHPGFAKPNGAQLDGARGTVSAAEIALSDGGLSLPIARYRTFPFPGRAEGHVSGSARNRPNDYNGRKATVPVSAAIGRKRKGRLGGTDGEKQPFGNPP